MNSIERVKAMSYLIDLCGEMEIPTNKIHGLAQPEKAVLLYMAHRAIQERNNVMLHCELLLLDGREVQQ